MSSQCGSPMDWQYDTPPAIKRSYEDPEDTEMVDDYALPAPTEAENTYEGAPHGVKRRMVDRPARTFQEERREIIRASHRPLRSPRRRTPTHMPGSYPRTPPLIPESSPRTPTHTTGSSPHTPTQITGSSPQTPPFIPGSYPHTATDTTGSSPSTATDTTTSSPSTPTDTTGSIPSTPTPTANASPGTSPAVSPDSEIDGDMDELLRRYPEIQEIKRRLILKWGEQIAMMIMFKMWFGLPLTDEELDLRTPDEVAHDLAEDIAWILAEDIVLEAEDMVRDTAQETEQIESSPLSSAPPSIENEKYRLEGFDTWAATGLDSPQSLALSSSPLSSAPSSIEKYRPPFLDKYKFKLPRTPKTVRFHLSPTTGAPVTQVKRFIIGESMDYVEGSSPTSAFSPDSIAKTEAEASDSPIEHHLAHMERRRDAAVLQPIHNDAFPVAKTEAEASDSPIKHHIAHMERRRKAAALQPIRKNTTLQPTRSEAALQATQHEAALPLTRNEAALQATQHEAALPLTRNEAALQAIQHEAALRPTHNEVALHPTHNEAALQSTHHEAALHPTRNEAAVQAIQHEAALHPTRNKAALHSTHHEAALQSTHEAALLPSTHDEAALQLIREAALYLTHTDAALQPTHEAAVHFTYDEAALQLIHEAALHTTPDEAARQLIHEAALYLNHDEAALQPTHEVALHTTPHEAAQQLIHEAVLHPTLIETALQPTHQTASQPTFEAALHHTPNEAALQPTYQTALQPTHEASLHTTPNEAALQSTHQTTLQPTYEAALHHTPNEAALQPTYQTALQPTHEAALHTTPNEVALQHAHNLVVSTPIQKKAWRNSDATEQAKAANTTPMPFSISRRKTNARDTARKQKAEEARLAKAAKEAEKKAREEEARRKREERRMPEGRVIKPLPVEWERRVDAAMATAGDGTRLAATSAGSALSRRDLGTVLPVPGRDRAGGWLNDEVVTGYLQAVVDHGQSTTASAGRGKTPKFYAFNTFFYSSIRDKGVESVRRWAAKGRIGGRTLLEVERVFVPVHENSHWTMVVVSPMARAIEYFDSLGGAGTRHVGHVKAWLAQELGPEWVEREWTVVDSPSPRQANGLDCGVFAVTTAKMITLGINPLAYGPEDIPVQRRRMVAELLNGGFVGDFEP